MKPYVLVIVDMQPAFSACNDERTIKNVQREIRAVKKAGGWIVVLEYKNLDSTHHRIRRSIAKYDKVDYFIKDMDDGSQWVEQALNCWGVPTNTEIRLVGINYGACVQETAFGLIENVPAELIQVVEDACNQPPHWEEEYTWGDFSIEGITNEFIERGINVLNTVSC